MNMFGLDDPTGIQDKRKQEALNTILYNINQMYENAEEGDVVSETVSGITLKDIDRYMVEIVRRHLSPIKLLRIRAVEITNPLIIANIHDYTDIDYENDSFYQKIYFIEGGDFALTFMPIQEDEEQIRIHMEPLDSSPKFIKKIFIEQDTTKSIGDLTFLKAKDLKPRNKQRN
ncbi:MAG: hypothetical protein AB9915_03400 [Candidatus Dojkabacteria bacterium]